MIATSCHCGQIHYRIFTTTTANEICSGVQFIQAHGLIENACKSLARFVVPHSKAQTIQEHGFCKHCGASIYIMDDKGNVSYAVNHLTPFQVDYSGSLNFGL
ncbi:hypothetical protein [Pseudoalteromonas piscicida]|uniref:Uncharacterized protein n=1 Tax=Pseudoalteromonas piscicida TaxID=43662 RepID=A0AAD0W6M4_PSEO7|nr:hypothetical protein [Pseudoalteromonas piscicida]ASD69759.1 hypothetical protein B1L02_23240 [Pseudoalteromonas piscicida]AXR00376.1 hypothetical protein D0N37_22940 [Pseudoalteromonas piscicida]AXR04746.1 hypothetical protein D0511_23085 [Pseudoalteromonas piscicida]